MRTTLTIRQPDDFHVHLREGAVLKAVLPHTAKVFERFVAMPNTQVPLTTPELARAYRDEMNQAIDGGCEQQALVPCYLHDATDFQELHRGHAAGDFFGAKFYPAGATTASHAGVTDIRKLYPVFAKMEKHGMPLLMHGEVVDPEVDIYDREKVFIDRFLVEMVEKFPNLVMTMEHLTTAYAVNFVADHAENSALKGSITLHHMMLNRNDMLNDGLRADYFCYPLVKTEADRLAIRQAAVSGKPCYFLGSDSAPHLLEHKYAPTAKAGIYTAADCLAGYAQVFDEEGAIERLEDFASVYGAKHYGLALNAHTVTLTKHDNPPERSAFTLVGEDKQIRHFPHSSRWTIEG